MSSDEHLQFTEVLNYLKDQQQCAIVHVASLHEVTIGFDRRSTWHVQTTLKQSPDASVQRRLKAAKLKTHSREMHMAFGPNRGETIRIVTVAGDFESAETAARTALSIFDIAWQVSATEWLWVTASLYDDRGDPKRPAAWPPVGTPPM